MLMELISKIIYMFRDSVFCHCTSFISLRNNKKFRGQFIACGISYVMIPNIFFDTHLDTHVCKKASKKALF